MRRYLCVIAVMMGPSAIGTAHATAPDCPNGGIRDVVSVLHLDRSKMTE